MRREIIDENLHEFNSQILKLIIHKIFVHAQQKIMPPFILKEILISIIFSSFFPLVRCRLELIFMILRQQEEKMCLKQIHEKIFFSYPILHSIYSGGKKKLQALLSFLRIASEKLSKILFHEYKFSQIFRCSNVKGKKILQFISHTIYNVNALHRIYHFLVYAY